MIKIITPSVLVAVIASCLFTSGVNAQGRLGDRYVGFGGGYVRISHPDDPVFITDETFHGGSIGANINLPLSPGDVPVGFDLNAGTTLSHLTNDDVDLDMASVGLLFRGFVPTGADIKPYAGVGLGLVYAEVSTFGFSESDSAISFPLEVGVEFVAGAFSIRPFYRYTVATESDHDDYWSAGVSAALWFSKTWGMTVGVTHSDLGDGWKALSIGGGALISF